MNRKTIAVLMTVLMLMSLIVGCSVGAPEKNAGTNQDGAQKNESNPPSEQNNKVENNNSDNVSNQPMRQDNVLKYANWSNLVGALHPDFAVGAGQDVNITDVLYEPLVRIGLNNKLECVLAESYEISDDAKTVTFYLRQGVKWHDGVEFTADDVKFTIESNATKGYVGSYAGNVKLIEGYDDFNNGKLDSLSGVEVVDKYTIKITTSEIYGPFMYKIGELLKIVPKHKWENIPANERQNATDELRSPIGTGPFKFKEFVVDQYIMLEKYDDYWNGQPKIDGILYKYMNQDTAQASALNGELDMMQISSMNPDDIKTYTDAGFDIQELWWTSIQYVILNNENELLKDKRVRQALTYAVDRQGIVDGIYDGYASVENTPYISSQWGSPDKSKINLYEYNPQKAIDILTDEVGWEYKDNKMYVDGKEVSFELMCPTGNKSRERAAPVIQQNLKDIGINIDLVTMEMATQVTRLESGDFDMGMMGNGMPDPDMQWLFGTGESSNYERYSSEKADAMLLDGVSHLTQEEREPIYQDFAIFINDEMPMIPLCSWCDGLLIPPGLVGVKAEDAAAWKWYDLQNWYFTNIQE